jgi:Recombination endonuclease VII
VKTCPTCGLEKPATKYRNRNLHCNACVYVRSKATEREYWLRSQYGIGQADYDQMLAAQGGGCAICAGTNGDGRPLAVDHNHLTGQVRGLLCHNCNHAIGKLKADAGPDVLASALSYILSTQPLEVDA